jgi:hypothetical protein
VSRVRRYLASFTITPLGTVLLVVFVAALGVFAIGPSQAQAPAFVVAVLLLTGMLGSNLPQGPGGRIRSLAERRREFHPDDRAEDPAPPLAQAAEDELWRKERERYGQADR